MSPLLLAPLELLYGSLVRARNKRFDRSPVERLGWPVVSIGNLSVGGAGKTPLVIGLALLLEREGFHVDVLSRGYGRSEQTVERVDGAGSVQRYGDEPLLIARSTGVPVYVGASRYEAGLLAESEHGGQGVHLLDDGFQHRQLGRNLDIVVVHRSDLKGRLLPAGRLREPLWSLSRADVIVLRQEDAELESAFRAYARRDCCFWRVRRSLALPSLALLGKVQRAVAFCGIARPDEFFQALAGAGVEVVERKRFRDHHRYTTADVERLAERGRRLGCDAFVMTAKDEVKLDAAMRARLNAVAPLFTAALTVEIEDEEAVLGRMRKSLIVTER
jgi:tetraacyldisaccharide 4'-kinase